MEIVSGIYKIESLIDKSKFYIGSSVDVYKRWKKHSSTLIRNKHYNRKLQDYVNKYGIDNLFFSLLETCDPSNTFKIEQKYLDLYEPYFNMSLNAQGCAKGNIPWNKGKKTNHIPWNKGLKMPEEQRLRMLGHITTEETKIKIKLKCKGRKYHNKKMDKNFKAVVQLTKDYVLIQEFNSMKEAQTVTHVKYQDIGSCCREKLKSAGGYIWRYSNEYYRDENKKIIVSVK